MRTILIIGPIPPPIGGVSIHILRLIGLLEADGYKVELIDESPIKKSTIFNFRTCNIISYVKLIMRADIVHIQSSINIFRMIHMISCIVFRKPFVITLHSWRIKSSLVAMMQKRFFAKAKTIVCVNKKISNSISLTKCTVMPAFLPPIMEKEKALPSHINEWIERAKSLDRTLVVANAYRLDQYDCSDLYGLDMAIRLMDYLVNKKNMQISFVFVVTSLHAKDTMFAKYSSEILDLGLADNFLLTHEKDLSFVNLIEKADITCRLTNTDGDALSVRESLYLRKTTVASDAVERPIGTTLFNSRNQNSLNSVILKLLVENTVTICSLDINTNYVEFYKSLYHEQRYKNQ